jgi:ankyrin repeat protein
MKIDKGRLYKSHRIPSPFRDHADEDLYKASSQIAALTDKDEISEYKSAKDFLTTNNRKIQDPDQALARAAEHDDAKELLMLLELGADANAIHEATGRTPLHYAADRGNLNIAVMLIAKGADVNARDPFKNTPLHVACKSNLTSMVFLLLAAGADINATSQSGLPADIARRWTKNDLISLLNAKEAIDNPTSSANQAAVHQKLQRCRIM